MQAEGRDGALPVWTSQRDVPISPRQAHLARLASDPRNQLIKRGNPSAKGVFGS
jgi:hypothetical protein